MYAPDLIGFAESPRAVDQSRDSLMQACKISAKSVQVAEDGQTPAHHTGLSLLEVAMLQDMLFERLSKMEWLMGSSVLFQKRVLLHTNAQL